MGASGLFLHIPEEVLSALKLPPQEAREELLKELAVALYRRGLLALGKARFLAGMARRDFEELLGRRGIVRRYGEKDLEDDLAYALGRPSCREPL